MKISFIVLLMSLISFSCSSDSPSSKQEDNKDIKDDDPVDDIDKVFYKGTTMGFTKHQEEFGNVVFKENGVANDPFKSLFDHGANMVRFRIDMPPYSNDLINGKPDVDFRSPSKVKSGILRAQNAGLKTQLTFSYKSSALNPEFLKNEYVAPLEWQSIAGNLTKLREAVYNYTYDILKDYLDSGITPEIVSIGNETNWRFIEENLDQDKLDDLKPYAATRTVALLNAGTKAVRDINVKYSKNIKVAIHLFDASKIKWWLNSHSGIDYDVLGLSHYHAWHNLGDFKSWTEVVKWVKSNKKKDFLILETAQLFRSGGNDSHVDILGTNNIPSNYINPPTTATQRLYLRDFAQEIKDSGGLGLIVWGGEWVGSNTTVYADKWGAGSSWENKAFWDFDYNLHDGVNWMQDVKSKK